jgi:hypothetical protein
VLLEQLETTVITDRVGDPRPDEVRRRTDRDGRPQRVFALVDVEAGEEHRRLRRDRDARALGHHEQEDSGQAEVAHDVGGEGGQPVGDRREDEDDREHDGSG